MLVCGSLVPDRPVLIPEDQISVRAGGLWPTDGAPALQPSAGVGLHSCWRCIAVGLQLNARRLAPPTPSAFRRGAHGFQTAKPEATPSNGGVSKLVMSHQILRTFTGILPPCMQRSTPPTGSSAPCAQFVGHDLRIPFPRTARWRSRAAAALLMVKHSWDPTIPRPPASGAAAAPARPVWRPLLTHNASGCHSREPVEHSRCTSCPAFGL